ncbi:MarR family winged helix-turn-helix transcriptional regulator [Sinomicrobium weinanense]|uniref:Winged helix-turn-helix transcriptional regulator n=1 Tax=Sinomicrobium weinanense TaxID=2842200 RepID=A0A926JU63_9FLAO|nr:MarR family winged helix-turn-helix transcriptional regulator [Sinomicrobium weinanense]MBC9797256.1 winged helix-turn-helix transcriptional regulator [Sinomicrobium weinanense]MBU3122342.1 MarR family winged helix-turn-helix transcriptional regulator [Sinomicrobium weinanense]
MNEEEIIHKIRKFNRSYVRSIGLLEKKLLNSDYSLTESQILYLVNDQKKTTATEINKILKLDEGYLSRIIKKLISKSLLTKEQSFSDKRIFEIRLTEKGLKEQQKLDTLSSDSIRSIIAHLNKSDQSELANLFNRIMTLLYKK